MPVYFQYPFGKKVTVIIDCLEVFIEEPSNLLARAQTFSKIIETVCAVVFY